MLPNHRFACNLAAEQKPVPETQLLVPNIIYGRD